MITLLHIIFVLFIITSPFMNSNYFLLLHSLFVPFIIFHWYMNNDKCMLSIIEKNLRKKLYPDQNNIEQCFTCRLIEPVYNFTNKNISYANIIYIFTIILWLISSTRLSYKYKSGSITKWQQLFVI